MKHILLLLLVLVGTQQGFAQEPFSSIKGTLEKKGISKICLFRTINGREDTIATTSPSADGTFGFLLKVPEAAFYTVGDKQKSYRLYLKPGDAATVLINDSLMTFVGGNTKENLALGKWQQFSQPLKKMTVYFYEGRSTYKEIFPELEKVEAKAKSFVKMNSSGNKIFDNLMNQVIRYDLDYYTLMGIYTPRVEHPNLDQYPMRVKRLIGTKDYDDDNVLKQPYGEKLLTLICTYLKVTGGSAYNSVDKQIAALGGNLSKGVLVVNVAKYFKSYKEFQEIEEKYGSLITNADLKGFMEKIRLSLIDYKEGTPAYNFTYADTSGRNVSLSDFKGKVVLVDVWATWCGPCKKELPSLNALEQEYEGKDVVFISVSTDSKKDLEKWKAFVKEHHLGGVQLFAGENSTLSKDYRINGIPRFMLFDKKGAIVTVDAPRPSNPDLKYLINNQLSK
ncbi:TlpA family protein disulfide reductase [Alistipes sp. ZOR0009]|uniref:TlpA family protein disulfide reductase n=1 Tax=Alistipes sp. ZOR0009 TaxID=1339253 RepID=UPI00068C5164|nr:TlpA disulfide reductase family protein [Alistipes sp. ZOR0009]